jgi:signal transduction histidine kinase
MQTKRTIKITLIAALVVLITLLHYGAIRGHLGLHILHRELYFIPILLASFWFGLKFGLTTAVVVSFLYAPHVFVYDDPHGTALTVTSQILVFNLVALVLGWLTDRQKRQQQEVLEAENLAVLGRAAVAVGYEMKDILGALNRMSHQAKGMQCTELDHDFAQEMARLEGVVDTLSSFSSPERVHLLSRDLNEIVLKRVQQNRQLADKAGVHLKAVLDESGCPSRLDVDRFGWVLNNLLKNAIEVSRSGQTIHVRTHRSGLHCQVEVQDEGPGIRPEDLPKIFLPFFTTKEKGTGLGLAACRKITRDLGGDIQVASTWGEGATFTLTVPREDPARTNPDIS